jgi:hypothetical protein
LPGWPLSSAGLMPAICRIWFADNINLSNSSALKNRIFSFPIGIWNFMRLGRPMRRRLNHLMLRIIFFFFMGVNSNQRFEKSGAAQQ